MLQSLLLLCFLNILTLFIFVNIKQTGWVLNHYEKVWTFIREMVLDKSLADKLNVRKQCHPSKKLGRRLFSAQKSVETLLLAVAIFLDAAGFWVCAKAYDHPHYSRTYFGFMLGVQLIIVYLQFKAIIDPWRDSRRN